MVGSILFKLNVLIRGSGNSVDLIIASSCQSHDKKMEMIRWNCIADCKISFFFDRVGSLVKDFRVVQIFCIVFVVLRLWMHHDLFLFIYLFLVCF